MTTETILTDDRIEEIGSTHSVVGPFSFARAIEQAVLQSPEVQRLREDAELYRALREMWWHESPLCVVSDPKSSVRPGSDCPSGERLDVAIRATMKEQS